MKVYLLNRWKNPIHFLYATPWFLSFSREFNIISLILKTPVIKLEVFYPRKGVVE